MILGETAGFTIFYMGINIGGAVAPSIMCLASKSVRLALWIHVSGDWHVGQDCYFLTLAKEKKSLEKTEKFPIKLLFIPEDLV